MKLYKIEGTKKLRKCWWRFFHDWSNWEIVDAFGLLQMRSCKKCGKTRTILT